ncbi:hypothetical protein, partial [Flagellimonas marinaquae]
RQNVPTHFSFVGLKSFHKLHQRFSQSTPTFPQTLNKFSQSTPTFSTNYTNVSKTLNKFSQSTPTDRGINRLRASDPAIDSKKQTPA